MDDNLSKEKLSNSLNNTTDFVELQKYLEGEELENKNSNNIEKDTRKYELECMLPDYLFNRLSDTEKEKFEIEIVNYPDLEEELQEAQKLFARINEFDFDKMVKDKSQYLPDRVVERLAKRNELFTPKKMKFKWLIVAGAMAAAVLLYVNFGMNNITTPINIITNVPESNLFTTIEKEYIYENIVNEETAENNIDVNEYYTNEIDIEELLGSDTDVNYAIITETIEGMDEQTFQELIAEFE